MLVNVTTKEFKDLTPKWKVLFQTSGDVNYDISPDGKFVALGVNITPPPYSGFLNVDIHLIPTDGSGDMKNVTMPRTRVMTTPRASPPTASRCSSPAPRCPMATASPPSSGAMIWPPAKTRR